MPKKNRKIKKILPEIKNDIKDFILSEEGKILKKDIVRLGISSLVLAMMLQPQSADAHRQHANSGHTSHTSGPQHSNAFFSSGQGGHNSSTTIIDTHSNSHTNYARCCR